ncbi:MAG TPA: GDCCVxC domain-containing (seleno)protein [Chloroflexota bacterium]|nr:GDCCVxC domain-containing (seleno)protein [Chloroflexota bacterium]HUM67272.1 GDCCVxC domain-containing (seleno)protein [Chloroflexota bacterium]
MEKIINHARITCPFCGFGEMLEIPADYCLFFHRCANCNMLLKPTPGDCCVFCSYGNTLCIPKRRDMMEEKRGQL